MTKLVLYATHPDAAQVDKAALVQTLLEAGFAGVSLDLEPTDDSDAAD